MKISKKLWRTLLICGIGFLGLIIYMAMPHKYICSLPLIPQDKLQLKHIQVLQKSYHQVNLKYSENLSDIGWKKPNKETYYHEYDYHVLKVDSTNFVILAVLLKDFDNDGELKMSTINAKGEYKLLQED